jgi:hypothetical protein
MVDEATRYSDADYRFKEIILNKIQKAPVRFSPNKKAPT